MGRLFLRLFVGIMLMQCGVRSLAFSGTEITSVGPVLFAFDTMPAFIAIMEIACSFFIMLGLMTRIMICPLLVLMIISAHLCLTEFGLMAGMTPFLFLGIYFFLLLVGPGKISVDYFYALHLIGKEDGNEIFELEEV